MYNFTSFAGCLLFTSSLLAVPVPPALPPTIPAEQLQEWIRDLDSDKFAIRDRAGKRLRAAGKDAVEPLKKAAIGGSSESMDRSLRILDQMLNSPDEPLSQTARQALKQIAESKSPSAAAADSSLRRLRDTYLSRLQQAGAQLQMAGDDLNRVYLENVEQPMAILPLLEEFPEIQELSATNRKFGDAEMKALPSLPHLDHFNLFQSGITDEALIEFKRFPKLASIPMGYTKVTDAGLKHLSKLTQLEYVGLRGNAITDEGVVHLKKLTNLTGLYLGETKVTDGGLAHLAGMTKMNYLRLHHLPISDNGLEHLKGMKELRSIELSNTKTTEEGREKLKEAIEGLRIVERDEQ